MLILTPDSLLVRMMDAHHWTVAFWRGLCSGILLFGYLVIVHRGNFIKYCRSTGKLGFLAIVFYVIGTIGFVYAINNTLVSHALVILATIPKFSALFSWFFFKDKLSLATLLVLFLTFIGVGIVGMGSLGEGQESSFLGDLSALVGAICFAANLNIARADPDYDAIPTIGIAGLLLAFISVFFAPTLVLQPSGWLPMILMACVVVPISYIMIFIGPKYIPTPEVGLMLLVETVLGPFWVWLVLEEEPTVHALIGGTIIVSTLLLFNAIQIINSYKTKRD